MGLDYYRLLRDLIYWNSPRRSVQNQWARDYYWKSNTNENGEDRNEKQK